MKVEKWLLMLLKVHYFYYHQLKAQVLNLSIYYTWKYVKKVIKNNKFKVSAPTWNNEFEFADESYSVSDIQDCFK